ncbi:MAG: putative aspartyl protease [Cognaticolwellia sp.]|jgi:predicted aspartyl protease
MRNKNIFKALLVGLLTIVTLSASAQAFGYQFIKKGKKKVRLKFEQVNNLIILPITLNDTFELKFIVDTGVRHTVITKKSYLDSLSVHYGRKFRLTGADKESFVDAQLVHGLKYGMKGVEANSQTALVLDDDYFGLDNSLGFPIHGILGMDLFMRYTVKIDYETNTMTLTEPDRFKVPKSCQAIDIELIQGKPYIESVMTLENGQTMTNKLLIDCGASLSLMLDMNSDERITLPEKFIHGIFGQVLGGDLEAYVGRVNFVGMGNYAFKDVVTNFQIPFWIDTVTNTNGLIGGGILSRFDVTYDFMRNKIYLRKNSYFDAPFTQDRSGLHIKLQGNSFNQFIIADVIAGSPADVAGIQTGDIILKCNGKPFERLSLDYITNTLQRESETMVRLTILRNGSEVDVKFKLEDLI